MSPLPWPIQAKLEVGAVDDPLEREADRVADQVMRMVVPVQTASGNGTGLQRKCAACKEEEEESLTVRKKHDGQVSATGEAPPIVHEALRSPGQPLDSASRSFFEPRFRADLGWIRIHDDDLAARSAASVGALAYTTGGHIFFAQGRYSPDSSDGRRLLAHELTHSMQQGAPVAPASIARMPTRPPLGITAADSPLLQRQCAEYTVRNCTGRPCTHSTGGAGFCRWSGSVRIGCVCIKIENRFQEFVERVLHAALIALGITIAAAALVAVVACFATGLCELGSLLGAAAAALLALLLGLGSKEAGAATLDDTGPQEGAPGGQGESEKKVPAHTPGGPAKPATEPPSGPAPSAPTPQKPQVMKPAPAPSAPAHRPAPQEHKPAKPSGAKPHAPGKSTRPAIRIALIEGLNLDSVKVGRLYPVSVPASKQVLILQATGKETKGSDTTVDFVSVLECDPSSCNDGGNGYTVTHPYRGEGLIGESKPLE